ncbi:MAG: hypothetical protein HY673_19295 [Chloroflexi bacterium]|nr:hypothetical protein [Chloroflexota bacterium]
MAEPKMKSSWEIAMERAEKLGKPSEEEIKKRREETYVPIGQALAKKYLSGLPVRDLNIELEKYRDEDLKVVTTALLAELRDGISPARAEATDRAVEAWRLLRPSAVTERVAGDIKKLMADYEEAKKEEEERAAPLAEEDVWRELEAEGIAGSAVAVNLQKAMSRPVSLEGLNKAFATKLEELKDQLEE